MVRPVYQDPNRKSVESRSKAYDSTQLHKDDDVDSGRTAHHHTLGTGAGQAAPGDALAAALEEIAALEERILWLETDEMMVASAVPPGTHNNSNNWLAAGGFNTPWTDYPGTTISLPGNENLFGYSNGVLTPTVPVWFEISLTQEWAANGTGRRAIVLAVDGDVTAANPQFKEVEPTQTAETFMQSVHFSGPCIPGHTVNALHFQNSGGNLVVNARHLTVRARKIHVTGIS